MFLIQLLLPLANNDGRAFESHQFETVRSRLTAKFGGVTVYSQAPADGVWRDGVAVVRDAIVLFEVMQERLRPKWWQKYRSELMAEFEQQEIVVRAHRIRLL